MKKSNTIKNQVYATEIPQCLFNNSIVKPLYRQSFTSTQVLRPWKAMLTVLYFIISISVQAQNSDNGFYSFSLAMENGSSLNMSSLAGKRTAIIILSGTETANQLDSLIAFFEKNKSKAVFVALYSQDDNYPANGYQALKNKAVGINDLQLHYTIALPTRAGAAAQPPLVQWLTQKEKNHHFQMEITQPGYKFFVNTKGKLYAAMVPQIPLSSPVFDRIMNNTTQ